MPFSHGQYLADHIAGAKLVDLPGTEQSIVWETPQLALGHIEEFLTGAPHGHDSSRVLATVLFTDVEQAGGRLVKTTGDGILATFDGPG